MTVSEALLLVVSNLFRIDDTIHVCCASMGLTLRRLSGPVLASRQ